MLKSFLILLPLVAAQLDPFDYKIILNHYCTPMILNNKTEMKGVFRCILDEDPCSPLQQFVKVVAKDVYANNCEYCTDNEKQILLSGATWVSSKYPSQWSQVMDKLAPGNPMVLPVLDPVPDVFTLPNDLVEDSS